MGKELVIAEKPSVGKDIAKTLKCNQKGKGFLYNDKYIVSWAIGHLVELCEPDEYDDRYKKWKLDTLPIIPPEIKLKAVTKTKEQLNILKTLMNSNETGNIICATDSGREGELIFRYIYKIVKCKKPFKRLWISSMTDTAILDGFSRLTDGKHYDNLYFSAKCRSEADWLVGINASRAFSLQYNALLSIGRVQTPTLAILTERQKEINTFVPKDYWEITALFETPQKESYSGKWFDNENEAKENETKIFDEKKAMGILSKIKGQEGNILSTSNEEKEQPPPLLYDLTELQRDCNKKFGFSASKTLAIAQDLYEKRKMVTYPRTDSRYLSSDMLAKITNILKRLENTNEYNEYAAKILSLDKLPVTKRIIDNTKISDHHAIVPTDGNLNPSKLTLEEKNVFGLIAIRFLAVFYENYKYTITKIVTCILGENFITKGSKIINLGWMGFYKNDLNQTGAEKEHVILPNVKTGGKAYVLEAKQEKKKTTPPKLYTEATLLSAMENAGRFIGDEALKEQMKDSGLGTPATRASIFERLITVGYVERKGKALIPTEKGMKLIEIVPNELKSPETTGKWEKGLLSIAKGKMDDKKFMLSITRYVNYIIEEAKKAEKTVTFPKETYKKKKTGKKPQSFGSCPVCGIGGVLENTKAYYCSRWHEGCNTTIWKNLLERYGLDITGDLIKQLLALKKIENVSIILPKTNQKGIVDLSINAKAQPIVEITNIRYNSIDASKELK